MLLLVDIVVMFSLCFLLFVVVVYRCLRCTVSPVSSQPGTAKTKSPVGDERVLREDLLSRARRLGPEHREIHARVEHCDPPRVHTALVVEP